MKACTSIVLAFACVLAVTAEADKAKAAVTPVQKVISLLEGMLAKGQKDKHDEEVQYTAYKQFCADTEAEKKASIEEAAAAIEQLTADITLAEATSEKLLKEIADLEASVAAKTAEIGAADKQRATAKADYDAKHKDYSESIDALQRAIAVLKKQAYDRKQASSMIQLSNLNKLNLIPENAKQQINLFLAQGEQDLSEDLVEAAPESNAYEFQSGGVVSMLEKLLDKFIDERHTMEKEEMNSQHSYDVLVADLKAQIKKAEEDISHKSAHNAKTLEQKAADEGELKDTTDMKKADEAYLSDMLATCAEKGSAFADRQKLRAEEIATISKAIEIISSEAVQGSAEKYLPSLVQTTNKAVLAHLRTSIVNDAQRRAATYLQTQAQNLNSRLLSVFAERIAADPFVKVKKMIKDLIVRLMEEANEEAEHKGWCDTELSTNEQTRKEKADDVESLKAEIDKLESSIAELTTSIKELTKAVADITAAMSEATEIRSKEKASNEETVEDAKTAQSAVEKAISVLKLFYEKAGEATAFVQRQAPPAIFDGAYKGMQSEQGGVVGFLEVIMSDFSRLEAETKAAEAEALKAYEKFMEDSAVDKSAKQTEIDHKTKKKADQVKTLTSKKSDLDGTQQELDAALTYYEKLKPSCVDAGVSAEQRVGRRQEEMQSLQEALKILDGADIA